jgi:hypothetical protein
VSLINGNQPVNTLGYRGRPLMIYGVNRDTVEQVSLRCKIPGLLAPTFDRWSQIG